MQPLTDFFARLILPMRRAAHRQHIADLQQRLGSLLNERDDIDREIVATASKLIHLLRQSDSFPKTSFPLTHGVEHATPEQQVSA